MCYESTKERDYFWLDGQEKLPGRNNSDEEWEKNWHSSSELLVGTDIPD